MINWKEGGLRRGRHHNGENVKRKGKQGVDNTSGRGTNLVQAASSPGACVVHEVHTMCHPEGTAKVRTDSACGTSPTHHRLQLPFVATRHLHHEALLEPDKEHLDLVYVYTARSCHLLDCMTRGHYSHGTSTLHVHLCMCVERSARNMHAGSCSSGQRVSRSECSCSASQASPPEHSSAYCREGAGQPVHQLQLKILADIISQSSSKERAGFQHHANRRPTDAAKRRRADRFQRWVYLSTYFHTELMPCKAVHTAVHTTIS